ncbi:MAG TPA: tRNA (N(6)-L-threonylcarbamoyladenosine(37)-C(2))-methylthiotransferase [Thermoplasmata archaeon]
MKAYVEAYGCTLNYGEAREIEDILSGFGWTLVDDEKECDLAVLVSCVVIETTERAMLKRVRELSAAPQLIVTGCMATAGKEKAEAIAPRASFVGPGDYDTFSRLIARKETAHKRPSRLGRSYSIVPIASGCRGSCSYCITRLARGDLRSRPPKMILDSIAKEVADGPREVQLTAQDTAAYGSDIRMSLPELVRSACEIDGDFRLRVGMMNPSSAKPILRDLADMFLEKKVFKFMHLPVQSASDRLLADMERGYNVADFNEIVRTVRSRVPSLTLSTDIIVGYPGEAPEDHESNLELIRKTRPDIVNVTRFSARPGTKAAEAEHPVVGWMAKDRSREITSVRFAVAKELNDGWVGRMATALATERGKGKSTIARTDEYKQVVVPETLPLGMFYKVEITGATPTYLTGRRVASP